MRYDETRMWPRLAADVAVVELPPEEGPLRHVLRRPGLSEACIRLDDAPAAIALSLDGSRHLDQLVEDVRAEQGEDGPALLIRVLAELGERGFLDEIPAADVEGRVPLGLFGRLGRPRTWRWRRAPGAIESVYRSGGWILVRRPALFILCVIAAAGFPAAATLVRAGTAPLVVGGQLGFGAACFLAGRAILVVFHELAHGLALAALGHRVQSAGLKLLAIFPYAFVDTSPAWLETRRRRMAVTVAGPVSDLVLAGAAAIVAALTHGTLREVFFQLSIAGYLAALLNLNPCLERDGYHLLCDAIRRPGLRRAALIDLQSRLAGLGRSDAARPLRVYGVAIVAWGVVGAALAVASLSRSLPTLRAALPHDISRPLLGTLWLALLAPTALLVGRPLALRSRGLPPAPHPTPAPPGPSPLWGAMPSRRGLPRLPEHVGDPFARLATQVMLDASLRERLRMLGPPPGLESLGNRELKSSVAGVVLAAGGESLAIAHGVGVLAPQLAHVAEHAIHDTNLSQLHDLIGPQTVPLQPAVHLEPAFTPTPHVPVQTPILYEPPAPHHHAHEHLRLGTGYGAGAFSASAFNGGAFHATGGGIPPWPGNGAGQVAIAHWMATGAQAAGLPAPLPVMAALVESNLNNNACCDHDSLGYFQMRESIWNHAPWTGYYQHPELQLEWFIHQALIVLDEHRAAGDTTFGQDPSSWGTWVADIEQPAAQYRGRYAEQLANAESLLRASSPLPGVGAGAFGTSLTGGASALADSLLQDSRVSLPAAAQADVQSGAIDSRVIAVLLDESQRYTLGISVMKTGHSEYTTSGYVSNHYYGRAVDVAIVNGVPVSPSNSAAHDLVLSLDQLPPEIRPDEIGSPWLPPGPGYFTNAEHQNHVHIGFKEPATVAVDPSVLGTYPSAAGGGAATGAVDAAGTGSQPQFTAAAPRVSHPAGPRRDGQEPGFSARPPVGGGNDGEPGFQAK